MERRHRGVVSCGRLLGAAAFLALLSTQIVGLLKKIAGVLGAQTIGVLFIGLAAQRPDQEIDERARQEARRLGKKLVS